jgi:hypothetical protein
MRSEDAEWFEYPVAWAEAYRKKRGSLRYFSQYALMELLRQRHGIEALTWLHVASIDRTAKRRVAAGEPWAPASPSPSRDPGRTARRQAAWDTMRKEMGPAFDLLQESIVRAKFVGAYQGEPDLFCWAPGGWFFAEAKRLSEPVLPSQRKWWRIAGRLPGIDCQIFACRLIPEGTLPPGQVAHSPRWERIVGAMRTKASRRLGSADSFVRRVLRRGA